MWGTAHIAVNVPDAPASKEALNAGGATMATAMSWKPFDQYTCNFYHNDWVVPLNPDDCVSAGGTWQQTLDDASCAQLADLKLMRWKQWSLGLYWASDAATPVYNVFFSSTSSTWQTEFYTASNGEPVQTTRVPAALTILMWM